MSIENKISEVNISETYNEILAKERQIEYIESKNKKLEQLNIEVEDNIQKCKDKISDKKVWYFIVIFIVI